MFFFMGSSRAFNPADGLSVRAREQKDNVTYSFIGIVRSRGERVDRVGPSSSGTKIVLQCKTLDENLTVKLCAKCDRLIRGVLFIRYKDCVRLNHNINKNSVVAFFCNKWMNAFSRLKKDKRPIESEGEKIIFNNRQCRRCEIRRKNWIYARVGCVSSPFSLSSFFKHQSRYDLDVPERVKKGYRSRRGR